MTVFTSIWVHVYLWVSLCVYDMYMYVYVYVYVYVYLLETVASLTQKR